MAIVYLNKDKSVFCDVKDSGKFIIVSNHTNKNNLKTLADHLSNLVSVEKLKGKMVVNLNKKPYAVIVNSGEITYLNPSNMLTSFETRLFAQSKNVNNLPFERFEKQPVKLKTDLHTHFAGALTPEQLIDCGIGNNVVIPKWILDKVGIDYSYLKPNENNDYKLEDVISSSQNTQLLINAMKIDTSEQETFNKMEEIYAIRGPFTKNPQCLFQ